MAACLFVTHGYEGVSLDAIVQAAGGSKTNIYAFYGGKEGLFVAAMEQACEEALEPLVAALETARQDGLERAEGLRRLGQALLEALLAPRALGLHRTVIGESGRVPAVAAAWYRAGPAFAQALLADFLQETAEAAPGSAHPSRDELVRTARLFHDMLAGDLQHRALAGQTPDETARAAAVDAALALIEPGQARR